MSMKMKWMLKLTLSKKASELRILPKMFCLILADICKIILHLLNESLPSIK